jgi:hypothetical protein
MSFATQDHTQSASGDDNPSAANHLPEARWSRDDQRSLAKAKSLLTQPGIAVRLSEAVGGKLDKGFSLLPSNWRDLIQHTTRESLLRGVALAANTLDQRDEPVSARAHQVLAGASGGIGGMFGLAALAWELPLSTTLMLRAMLDIAREEGHSPNSLDTRLSCLEVFALGGPGENEDRCGYWAVRNALAPVKSDASRYISVNGFSPRGAPVVVKFAAAVAAKFAILVSKQAAAKAIPAIGAVTGATVNVLFTRHFQAMARGHFILKRLESKYGGQDVERAFVDLKSG